MRACDIRTDVVLFKHGPTCRSAEKYQSLSYHLLDGKAMLRDTCRVRGRKHDPYTRRGFCDLCRDISAKLLLGAP
jgi:hypothetical protein